MTAKHVYDLMSLHVSPTGALWNDVFTIHHVHGMYSRENKYFICIRKPHQLKLNKHVIDLSLYLIFLFLLIINFVVQTVPTLTTVIFN